MENLIAASFNLIDIHSPQFGYKLVIVNERTGETLLSTTCNPASGFPLKSAKDCMYVIEMYIP